jgi:hypothetical protein
MFEIVVATDKAYRLEDRADLKKFKLWHPHVDPVKWTQSLWEKIHGRVFLINLYGRKNIVVTRSTNLHDDIATTSLQNALMLCISRQRYRPNFVIGGARMYEEALLHPDCHIVHKSTVDSDVPCDTFFRSWIWVFGIGLWEIFTWGRYLTARLPFGLKESIRFKG